MIYCAIDLDEEEKAMLSEGAGPLPVVFQGDLPEERRLDSFLEASLCFGNVSGSWLEKTTHLKWIQLESVGFGEYLKLKNARSFLMTNLKGFFSVPVAESALAGILALFRGIDKLVLHKEGGAWSGASLRPGLRLLQESRVLILGSGNIGMSIKKLLTAFGAQITLFDKYQEDADITTLEDIDKLIPDIDILISCLPETEDTIGLLDQKRLNRLKTHAILVSVGRGSTVDEESLIGLLNSRKIGGCVLDVTQQEPIPPGHPLWSCPNTLLTQHTGGGWKNEKKGKVSLFLDNLERFHQDRELLNIVDFKKGF